jgi:hypothetical protein
VRGERERNHFPPLKTQRQREKDIADQSDL